MPAAADRGLRDPGAQLPQRAAAATRAAAGRVVHDPVGQLPKRAAERARAFAASAARSLGGAAVTRASSSRAGAAATSATARSKASVLARDGEATPLILRTYCSAAAHTSSSAAGGSKFDSGRMFRHMPGSV